MLEVVVESGPIEEAIEYLYEEGINEEGIDQLIEEIGLEEFVNFVDRSKSPSFRIIRLCS